MICGIGIDHCSISRINHILERDGVEGAFFLKTFTEKERAEGRRRHDKAAFYAARFAVKEAVFKALGTDEIDLRSIESLHYENGRPYVSWNDAISAILKKKGISSIHLSVTTENDVAAAFVIAESDN